MRYYEIQEHTAEVKTSKPNELTYDDCYEANMKFGNDDYEVVAKYESLKEAKEAFKNYSTSCQQTGFSHIWDVTYYELHFNDYDEDGDFITDDCEDTFIDYTEIGWED